MRSLPIALAVMLAGCVPASDDQRGGEAQTKDLATPVATTAPPIASPSASPTPAPSPITVAQPSRPAAEIAEREAPAPDPADMCWMDYCPCDTSDPDYGGADPILCRNLRGGVRVTDDMMSIGAGGRDARKQLREYRRDNPGSF